jgi:hypothetical protein
MNWPVSSFTHNHFRKYVQCSPLSGDFTGSTFHPLYHRVTKVRPLPNKLCPDRMTILLEVIWSGPANQSVTRSQPVILQEIDKRAKRFTEFSDQTDTRLSSKVNGSLDTGGREGGSHRSHGPSHPSNANRTYSHKQLCCDCRRRGSYFLNTSSTTHRQRAVCPLL